MQYNDFKEDDFVKDEYFQKWVLDPDQMTSKFWNNWLKQYPEKKQMLERAFYFVKLLNKNEKHLSEDDFDAMWQHIVQNRKDDKKRPFNLFFLAHIKTVQRLAAFLILALSLGYLVGLSGVFNKNQVEHNPPEPRITLEMEDGTVRFLDEESSEVLTDKKGNTIVNKHKTMLSYSDDQVLQELAYNKLTVPYGKKFELELSDGSHIYLNSGSKLRYPVKFLNDKPRDVFLDGEAYFEVAKDEDRPFTVITDDMNTQVYGTAFNVSSYKNEQNTSTVLVEGSVGVYKSNNNRAEAPIHIQPGNRAVLENGLIEINKVNVEKYTAWKEGKLVFIDDAFGLIVKELERHFDVSINNQVTALNQKTFTGTFTTESLDDILKIFKEHSGFNFSATGNTYNIYSKQTEF